MLYAPHTYKYRHRAPIASDEYGRPIREEFSWLDGGVCRCDDNNTQDLTDENGRVYRPLYKVVVDGDSEVIDGDEVEVYRKDGTLRGKGIAKRPIHTNYLYYSVFYLE